MREFALSLATLSTAMQSPCMPPTPVDAEAPPTRSFLHCPLEADDPQVEALRQSTAAVASTWMAAHSPQALAWNWGEGVLATGLLHTAESLNSPQASEYVRDYVSHHQDRGVPIRWSDHTTPALAAVMLALDGERSVIPIVERVVDYIMHAPRTERGMIRHLGHHIPAGLLPRLLPDVWVDSAFHIVPTLCRYSELMGDPTYCEEGARQTLLFLENLQDPETGLITHAYNDLPRDEQVPSFERAAFWARGNGWMIATLVDLLDRLPADHPDRGALHSRLIVLESALRALQTKSGLFHTLLLDASTYVETAGSALIIYGLARGAKARLFPDPDAAAQAACLGMAGLMDVLVVDGVAAGAPPTQVDGTSIGTNPVADLYSVVPTRRQVSYGVGAWLMAAHASLP